MFAPKFKAKAPSPGIWCAHNQSAENINNQGIQKQKSPPPPPVWTPKSAPASPVPDRRGFRPLNFASPTLSRKELEKKNSIPPPWSKAEYDQSGTHSFFSSDKQILSLSSPQIYSNNNSNKHKPNRLPKIQNPTVVLLQKTRENQSALASSTNTSKAKPNETVYSVKIEHLSESENEKQPKKMAQLSPKKIDGIGPTTREGIPLTLRSEVDEFNQGKWYKKMYETLHKAKNDDDYVTVRYKTRRGHYPYTGSGYMSEPEPNYDSDYLYKYNTLDRRRTGGVQTKYEEKYGTVQLPAKTGHGPYKSQPKRIENYIPGHSSISETESKQWWNEVMDIFDGHLEQQKLANKYTEGNLSRALLKDQGYDSDSTLVFRKKEESRVSPLSPVEQKVAYRSMQAGGEPPLQGFRKPAPEKPKETVVVPPPPPIKGVPLSAPLNFDYDLDSPRKYVEADVNIHYKTPIRYEFKESIAEDELAFRQAEHMKKVYQEEKRRKYMQELQDMNNRRHADYFTASQKSPIQLNRYDDFPADLAPKSPNPSKTIAKALYNFQGQTARELSFRKGDIIYIRRQIDQNWYEGEHNAMLGLVPSNYVEVISKDGVRQPPSNKKLSEGQARAKFSFTAQSVLELSLAKGELVTLTRRVDDNWFEGRIGERKGIFPVAYVEVLTDIGSDGLHLQVIPPKPNAHTLITRQNSSLVDEQIEPQNGIRERRTVKKTEILHVDTTNEPIAYRAMYTYRPQNTDELELTEGDTVFVLEKCDDGWYVGTSQRTGYFGTFPGNYVKKV